MNLIIQKTTTINRHRLPSIQKIMSISVSILLLFTLGFIFTMAVISKYNAHPDECFHVSTAKYYINHWLPPEVGNPETLDSYSNYGYSYLNHFDIVYLIAAKFSNIIKFPPNKRFLALRIFNVTLFIILLVLSLICKENRQFFSILLITPQVWYIFSYFNGDAFPLFLSILLGYQLVTNESAFNKYTNSNSWFDFIRGGIPFAILLGLLLISKKNYYIFVLFILFFLLWNIFMTEKNSRKKLLLKYAIVLAIALSIFVIRYSFDIAINGFNKKEKITTLAEMYAEAKYKPSEYLTSKSFYGVQMKDKGVPYLEIFSKYNWHKITFNSFFGVYGWIKIYAIPMYYKLIQAIIVLFLLFFIGCNIYKFDRKNRRFTFLSLFFIFGTIFVSTYHSWINDFQAQGRYLFPLIGLIAIIVNKNKDYFNPAVMASFVGTLFFMSVYSFVWVGLDKIAK